MSDNLFPQGAALEAAWLRRKAPQRRRRTADPRNYRLHLPGKPRRPSTFGWEAAAAQPLVTAMQTPCVAIVWGEWFRRPSVKVAGS